MGLFALRATAGTGESLAVAKSVAAAETPARNYDASLAMALGGSTEMGKMVIDFLLHDSQTLGDLQGTHFRPPQEIDHLLPNGLVLFPKALFFHRAASFTSSGPRFSAPGSRFPTGTPFLIWAVLQKHFAIHPVSVPAAEIHALENKHTSSQGF